MKIYASLLACDFAHICDELKKISKCDGLHLDIMDGHFVPNISYGPALIKAIRKHTTLPFDAHLMVTNPINYIKVLAEAGCDSVTFHVESQSEIMEVINEIKKYGMQAGLAIKPNTHLEKILKYLKLVDLVLVMTVEPGFGGQKFLETQTEKIANLRKIIDDEHLNTILQVDGGINQKTIKIADKCGANCCVVGTAIFRSKNYSETIKALQDSSVLDD